MYNMTKFIVSKVVNFAPVYAMTSCSCIYNLTTTSYSSVRWKYFEIVLTVFTLNPCSDNTDFRPLSLPLSNANFKCFKHSPQFANFLAIGLLIIADLVNGLKESASSVALKGKYPFLNIPGGRVEGKDLSHRHMHHGHHILNQPILLLGFVVWGYQTLFS